MSETEDIYTGECIAAWEDDELIYLNFLPNCVTICMSRTVWKDVKDELWAMTNKETDF